MVDGEARYFTEASIVAYSIKDARLPAQGKLLFSRNSAAITARSKILSRLLYLHLNN